MPHIWNLVATCQLLNPMDGSAKFKIVQMTYPFDRLCLHGNPNRME